MRAAWLLCTLAVLAAPGLRAQDAPPEWLDRLQRVFPAAERFSDRTGDPPVFSAWQTDAASGESTLVGYAFLTSDLPPEQQGFNGPIEVLVGMDLQGVLTGIEVVRYVESHRATRGDFLSARGFQEQFAGKMSSDPFRVRRDVDGISGATITVDAMSRGIRDSARRVAIAYGLGAVAEVATSDRIDPLTVTVEQIRSLSWSDLMLRGLGQHMSVLDDTGVIAEMSLTYLRNDTIAELILGERMFADVMRRGGDLARDRHLVLASLDGSSAGGLNMMRLSAIQGPDTVTMTYPDVLLFATPLGGKIHQEFRLSRVLLLDGALDMTRPITWVLDLSPGGGTFSAEYPGASVVAEEPTAGAGADSTVGQGASRPTADSGRVEGDAVPPGLGTDSVRPAAADSAPPVAETDAGAPGARTDPALPAAADSAGLEGEGSASVGEASGARPGRDAVADTLISDSAVDAAAPGASATDALPSDQDTSEFGLSLIEEETILQRTLARTPWARIALLLLLLGLVSVAFASKRPAARWATLTVTLLYLGFADGGFLSVSHITAGIAVGPSVYLSDISLLLIVAFTLGTTLLWGRVFCGFLCPFGALQDFLDRVVPQRLRREPSQAVHDRALYLKYGILALILVPALAGNRVSIYQYFEPFGTVFYRSPSILLWGIAAGILAACIVVPRFYCRYLCPLGAALAITSLLSPFRIRRVPQCTHCKVCEHACPTRAIRGAAIDFKECVRCNICEIKLIERAGVCRHDMAEVERRLVQLKGRGGVVVSDG